MSRNLSAAIGVQLFLLVSGTLSARLLGPENRGYLAILALTASAIGQLGTVGMSLAATYFLSARLLGGAELIGLLRRPAAIQISVLTLINAIVVLGYTLISGAPILLAACLSLIQLPAIICVDYGIAFLLGAREHGVVAGVRVFAAGSFAVGLIVLYLLQEHSLNWIVVIGVATTVCAGMLALVSGIVKARSIRVGTSIVKELGPSGARRRVLAFGRRGYVGYLAPVDAFRIDQLIVGFLVSPRALGIYVVGASFTNFTRLIAFNIGLSSTSEVASHGTPLERRAAVRHTLLLAGGVLAIVTLGLAVFVIFAIPILFGSAFRDSIPVAEILFVAGWFLAMKRIAVDAVRGAGEARAGTHAELLNLVLFLALCVPLGRTLGGPGVALAVALSAAAGSWMLIRRLQHLGILGHTTSSDAAPAA
jgi:O-antigen/teichoic acid export membrane protein